ncbi:MAG: hypothetical protein ABEI74_01125 [Candidatus Pacearchaeota archaeon]
MADLSDVTIGSEEPKNQVIESARIYLRNLEESIIGKFLIFPESVKIYDSEEEQWVPARLGKHKDKNGNEYFFLGTLGHQENLKKEEKNSAFYTGTAKNPKSKEKINTYIHIQEGKILTENKNYESLPILKKEREYKNKKERKYGSPESGTTELFYGGHPRNGNALEELNENNNLIFADPKDFLDNYSPLF